MGEARIRRIASAVENNDELKQLWNLYRRTDTAMSDAPGWMNEQTGLAEVVDDIYEAYWRADKRLNKEER